MSKYLHIFFVMFICLSSIVAQTGNIQGKVTDDLGLVMPGATVFLNTSEPTG
ncbi:MAG: hypothetical protein RIR48_2847, partial [Bacteroidota bacterium]